MQRFWEIDLLRGIAVVMMVIFHAIFDLDFFAGYNFKPFDGFWFYFGRATAIIFIFLVGVSLSLSFSRIPTKNLKQKLYFFKYLKRGLQIFSIGLLITAVTWFFLRQGFIVFGILHFIGLSVIASYPFLRLRYANLLFGGILIFIGLYLEQFIFSFNWLLWLGFVPAGFYSLDYYPMLPWFGLVLIGLFFGKLFYKNNKRKFKFFEFNSIAKKPVCFFGRHSLIIYLLHQPLLILVFLVIRVINLKSFI